MRSSVAFSPCRDLLCNGRRLRGCFFQFILELFPDSRHCEEHSRPCVFQRVYKCSLESIWSGKVNFTAVEQMSHDVPRQPSNVRKRQVRYESILWACHFWLFTCYKLHHFNVFPNDIIVTQHTTLWHSCRSACVN